MKVEILKINGSWQDVYNACMTTVNAEHKDKEPTDEWKKKMLMAQHSPIRMITVHAKFYGIPHFVMTHLTRHKIGVEWFVQTSRADRTGISREKRSQVDLIDLEMFANLQAISNISQKRLCGNADGITRQVWRMFCDSLLRLDGVYETILSPQCIYRGFCPEFYSCNYADTDLFNEILEMYRDF